MAIIYKYPPTGEPVTKEPWRWVAVFKDGSKLEQFELKDGQAIFHKFSEINPAQVSEFRLENDNQSPVILFPPEGSKLIHFYKIRRAQHLTDDKEFQYQETYKGFCIGYEINGRTVGAFVDHNNTIYPVDNFEGLIVAREK